MKALIELSPFYWILSLCTGVGQVFKNKSTNQLKNTLKMSKEDVKLLLVKFSDKNFWQWLLEKIISHSCKHLNCFTGSSVVVQTLESRHNRMTYCQYGHNIASKILPWLHSADFCFYRWSLEYCSINMSRNKIGWCF